jgi:hypothetical protein
MENKLEKLKVGDIIQNQQGVKKEIVKILSKSYLWRYPEIPKGENNLFNSINSNDPLFEWWVKIK